MAKISKKRFALAILAVFSLFYFHGKNFEVPILMYHHVAPLEAGSGLTVSPVTFERQMEFLKVHYYKVMALGELVKVIKSGKPVPRNAVVITFDDGNLDNFIHAFPILKKMDFPATIFMITDNINREDWLSEEDLRILDQSSISIGSHTMHHAFLPGVGSEEELRNELGESKKALETVLNHPVVLLSYPAGGVSGRVKGLVEELGYDGAVTTNYGRGRHDPYLLHRIKVKDSGWNLFNFWWKVSGLYHLGKKRILLE